MDFLSHVIPHGANIGAFSNKLICPHPIGTGGICGASSWEFVENIGSFRIRYRCKKCKRTIQYDFSNNLEHPYKVFGKNKWQRIVERCKKPIFHK